MFLAIEFLLFSEFTSLLPTPLLFTGRRSPGLSKQLYWGNHRRNTGIDKDGYTGLHILHIGQGYSFLMSLRYFIHLVSEDVRCLASALEEVATDSLE